MQVLRESLRDLLKHVSTVTLQTKTRELRRRGEAPGQRSFVLFDARDNGQLVDTHRPATGRTGLDMNPEDALEALRPSHRRAGYPSLRYRRVSNR